MSTDEPAAAGDVLDLRAVFARPWSGPATVWRPWWLRWLPVASTLRFRTEISDVHLAESTGLVVHDTMTFPNGKVWRRTMTARLVGPGRWEIDADDMPGGAGQTVTETGFRFTPYTIIAPVLGPIRVPLRCEDESRLSGTTTLTNTIDMRFLGLRVGRMVMTLERE
ncbi:hypothetical protein [Marmoricola sp. RAF53]|uniref:hypothetical protein n=1 Tax=Marmoricola sp. RAF53 TaxID=3233059 RepID=UPI003F98FACC